MAMKLAFELPPAQAERLRQEAARLGVAPDELARAALVDLLAAPKDENLAPYRLVRCSTRTANCRPPIGVMRRLFAR